mmetsp:Transcript_19544/g.45683  ORF Transcript_19544/g.45683 Transcript_19544/m.45683 type:complete len:202 (+) Transcript_19544:2562-3167(+)
MTYREILEVRRRRTETLAASNVSIYYRWPSNKPPRSPRHVLLSFPRVGSFRGLLLRHQMNYGTCSGCFLPRPKQLGAALRLTRKPKVAQIRPASGHGVVWRSKVDLAICVHSIVGSHLPLRHNHHPSPNFSEAFAPSPNTEFRRGRHSVCFRLPSNKPQIFQHCSLLEEVRSSTPYLIRGLHYHRFRVDELMLSFGELILR